MASTIPYQRLSLLCQAAKQHIQRQSISQCATHTTLPCLHHRTTKKKRDENLRSTKLNNLKCFSTSGNSCKKNDFDDKLNKISRANDLLSDAHDPAEDQDDWSVPLSTLPPLQPHQRKYTDPSNTSILLFPGQGSQFVGMGKDVLKYPNVEELFEVAGEILGYNLRGFCLNGPQEILDRTVYCQPAVFVTSLAAVEKLKCMDQTVIANCVAAAGFSVGEYAALVFAGALSFEEGIYLIKERAEAMQKASDVVKSGMLTVFGTRKTKYKQVCLEAISDAIMKGVEDPVCSVSTYLFPNARVIAGNVEALDYIKENSRRLNLRMVKPIPVSGAFHTTLMKPAQPALMAALDKVRFRTPLISVLSNVDAKEHIEPQKIRSALHQQIAFPVLWEQTLHNLYTRAQGENFPQTFEVGPGTQLGTMLKQINKRAHKSYFNIDV